MIVEAFPASEGRQAVAGLAKIGLVLRNEAWQRRGRTGLTPTQAEILAVLLARDGTGVRLDEIARALSVSGATASESLRILADKRLVVKERAKGDGRSLSVTLTAKGRRAATRATEWPDALLGAVGSLTSEEEAVFVRALQKIVRNLQDEGRIPLARMCGSCTYFRPFVHESQERPHHCAFVDAAFGDPQLRLDCPDHEAADPDAQRRTWMAFAHPQVSIHEMEVS